MRTTTANTTISIRLDQPLAAWLESEANRLGISQSELVRDELQRARKTKKQSKAFMRLAGTVERSADLSRRKGFSRQ